ncbi:MAG: HEAT repeat domain-containing protein [Lentisphaeraceae bacterium]|nr:HEAT repeat domain-containing protein [Lentisphaeraceae bacterium]
MNQHFYILLAFLINLSYLHSQELSITKFAEKPDLINPVSLTFDNQGKAYVTNARRRGGGSLDLRRIRHWVKNDLQFLSVEDRMKFYRENLKTENSKANKKTIKVDFNKDGKFDWRDLTAINDPFTTHIDSNNDGVADKHDKVFNPTHNEGTGLAAGSLWHDGNLYLMHEPNLWKYSDRDGDGKFDKREIISTGYSVHIGQGGHNTSGLAIGMDGRLYWSVADKGFNASSPDGKDRHVFPHRGAVMRCELDGSNLETFTLGVRNAQELAFDKYGNLFSVDNDGDYPTEKERFLYLIEGSQTGWRLHWQWFMLQDFAPISGEAPYNVWMSEKMSVPYTQGQAAYIAPTIKNYKDGPCGMYYNPGTALNSSFKDHLFHASGSEVTAFRVENDGASFKMVDEKVIAKGKVLTGLAIDPKGSLYVGSCMSYPNYPASNGLILKIDDPQSDLAAIRQETFKKLSKGFKSVGDTELVKNLSHQDLRVRRDSQFELVNRNKTELLAEAATNGKSLLERLHGIWGLGQISRKSPETSKLLFNLLKDSEVEIRANTLRALGDAKYTASFDHILPLLNDKSLRVQSLAAIAIGKLKNSKAIAPLLELAKQNNGKDAYLRHAIVMGLTGSSESATETLAKVSTSTSTEEKICSLLALRRLKSPKIAAFLNDKDMTIVTETARAIHDDFSIPEALPALAKTLERNDLSGEALLRRAINANLRVGKAENAQILKNFILTQSAPQNMKTTALACYAFWKMPPLLDPVEGRVRKYKERSIEPAILAMTEISSKLNTLPTRLSTIYLRVLKKLNNSKLTSTLASLYNNSKDTDLKIDILSTMKKLKAAELNATIAKAEASSDAKLKFAASTLTGKVTMKDLAKAFEKGSLSEQRDALNSIASFPGKEADKLMENYLTKLISGSKYKQHGLELIDAAKKRSAGSKAITDLIAQYKKKTSKRMNQYLPLAYGGDPAKGKEIAFGHPAAQCIRCHKIGDNGGILGPDLSKAGSKLKRLKIVQSIVDPAAEFSKGFGILTLTMKDGSVVSGTMKDEDKATYSILLADGKVQQVNKKDVKSTVKLSPMPPMKAILNQREIRDLTEYLSTLK